MLGSRQRSRQHNNQPSTEGCSGGVGGNNNGCHDDGGKGDCGSEGCEYQQQRQRRCNDATTRRSSSSSVSSTDANHGEEDGRRNCLAAAGGRTTRINEWAARRRASSGRHHASPLRRRQRPLALEDQQVLRHGFVPADRPAPPTATTTTTTNVSGRRQYKSNEMLRRPTAGDTIIEDRWTAGHDKEGSGQEQTTTNHCALKAGKRRPAERAAGDENGKDNANEEDEQRGGVL